MDTHSESIHPMTVRGARARCGTLAAVAVLAAATLLGACGSSGSSSSTAAAKTNLNTRRVALAIRESILSERHIHAKVTCPAVVPQQQGKNFVCTAVAFTPAKKGKTAKGKKALTTTTTSFKVTQQNSDGYVTYLAE